MQDTTKDKCLNVAATLTWIMGAIFILSAVTLGIPAIIMGSSNVAFASVILLVGVLYGYIGYMLKKRLIAGAIVGLVVCGLKVIVSAFGLSWSVGLIGFFIDLGIIALIITGWSRLVKA